MEQFHKNYELKILTTTYEGVFYEEKWVDIIGFEDRYQISTFGRWKAKYRKYIRSDGRKRTYFEKILHPMMRNGYCHAELSKNGQRKMMKIHQLVGIHFIPNPDNKPEVNHNTKKGTKTYNAVWALEWNTRKENDTHARENGLIKILKGTECSKTVLTEKYVLEIRRDYVYKLNSFKSLGLKYGVAPSTIKAIIYRDSWKHLP